MLSRKLKLLGNFDKAKGIKVSVGVNKLSVITGKFCYFSIHRDEFQIPFVLIF